MKGSVACDDPEPGEHILAVPVFLPGFADHICMFLHLVGKLFHVRLAFPDAEGGLFYPWHFADPEGGDKTFRTGHPAGNSIHLFPETAQFVQPDRCPGKNGYSSFIIALFGEPAKTGFPIPCTVAFNGLKYQGPYFTAEEFPPGTEKVCGL